MNDAGISFPDHLSDDSIVYSTRMASWDRGRFAQCTRLAVIRHHFAAFLARVSCSP